MIDDKQVLEPAERRRQVAYLEGILSELVNEPEMTILVKNKIQIVKQKLRDLRNQLEI